MALLRVFCCCVLSAVGAFLFGYDIGIIASVIEQDDFDRELGPNLSDNVVGGIVSSFTAGAILGTLAAAYLSDHYGRRAAIFTGATFTTIGGALQGGAIDVAMMIVGRTICGIGIGVMAPAIVNICLEVSPARFRGFLGGLQQWMLGLGIVIAQWVGYGSSLKGGSFSWRFPLSIQVLPALLLALTIYTIPESPRYLAGRDRLAEAEKSLRSYRKSARLDHGQEYEIVEEMNTIKHGIAVERQHLPVTSWSMLWQDRQTRKAALLACSIQLFTQTSGVNVIGYYGPRIYTALGYTATSSLFIQGIYGVLALVWNTLCLMVVDRIGRRKLLIPSMLLMGTALCIEATLVHFYDPLTTLNTNALRASVAMNFVFSIGYTSLGVISWIFAGEVFSNHMRARGTSLSTFTNWASNLVFAQCSPIALSRMGSKYLYFFVAMNWSACLVVWLFFPETQKSSNLEAVPELFGPSTALSERVSQTEIVQDSEKPVYLQKLRHDLLSHGASATSA